MKKWVCIFTAALLLVSLAGCAASGAQQNEAAATSGYYPAGGYEDTEEWRYQPTDPEEEYDNSPETPFKEVATSPLSTFSSDVDTASYSNMRRFINNGQAPEGVRIEELVNYFDYSYPRPKAGSEHPFSITAEVAPCPWNPENQLAMVGIQGMELESAGKTASNIVFLLDVSGSMSDENKLLLEKLDENDRVSIVTYAGSDKVIAEGVPGSQWQKLSGLIDSLSSGGSTAGAKGLETAYRLARENFIEGGNNRIILATDGDFNVGPSSEDALKKMVETEREAGISISVLGFGMYNLKDNKMETIADYGNGNYAYIDTLQEARKVLVDEFESTMFTIAQDLKIQVEFNPEVVVRYRLIGYNNRRLENEDFDNDQKDAGDIGAGHSVTAFYELVLVEAEGSSSGGGLTYQQPQTTGSSDYMLVKVRYKQPGENESKLVEQAVGQQSFASKPSENFAFASAVAEFGLIVTGSA
ncbi:MAG: vWA domain-containing protein [Oscillospiraceae bacterium]